MASYDFDLFTIGAGSGGVAASRRAAAYGARVAICEGSKVGGTCVIRGCVPKKLLVYGGQFRDAFEDAVGYGWDATIPEFHWGKLLDAKDREIDRLNQIYVGMLEKAGVTLFEGFGRLIDRHTVEVAGRRYTAKTILIAVGGHPVGPNLPGFEHAISSNEALDLKELPKRMVIVGGGYIAVEFAGIFNALGVEVTMMIRSGDLLNGFDDDIRQALAQEMRKRGITILTGVKLDRLEKLDDGYCVVTSFRRTASDGTGVRRHRPGAQYPQPRPGRGRRRPGCERRREGQFLVAHQHRQYLRGRRRHQPGRLDACRHRRGPRFCRDDV